MSLYISPPVSLLCWYLVPYTQFIELNFLNDVRSLSLLLIANAFPTKKKISSIINVLDYSQVSLKQAGSIK